MGYSNWEDVEHDRALGDEILGEQRIFLASNLVNLPRSDQKHLVVSIEELEAAAAAAAAKAKNEAGIAG